MYLAILVLLFGGMFLFVKQKLAMMEARINLLSETISTMAGITMNSIAEPVCEHESESDCDDSESDCDDSESNCDSESDPEIVELPDMIQVLPRVDDDVIVNPIKIVVSDDDVTTPVKKIVVDTSSESLSETPVKQIVVDTSYESLTVKELKEKISELNGPKLKTKKEMIEYLKNKI
jgi:hypothetical protein